MISVAHLAITLLMAATWDSASVSVRAVGGVLVAVLTAYNIIVISHLFTHVPWFVDDRLNALVSILNSVNIGQSVQAYQLTHVRNHHRFNNDRQALSGTTQDTSSTYRKGRNGDHEPLLAYALGGAVAALLQRVMVLFAVARLWKVGQYEDELLSLAARLERRRTRELRQVRLDRAAHCLSLVLFAVISWQWTLLCYIPAFFVGLIMVNVQNYYRHFGANPDERTADSVSYYGRFYNLLTFNDGYHQEHHLAPGTHWSKLPEIRKRYHVKLNGQPRVVSPVPAMLGFLDRSRPLLHRGNDSERTS
ncbi:fatty acid desaturase family protein [Nonomuraea sp. NPDC002799]